MLELCGMWSTVIYSYADSRRKNHNDTIIKTREVFFKKNHTSHFICNVCVWEGVGDRTELQYIDPYSYGHQRCVFLVLQGCCSTGGPGAHSAGFLYCILSSTGLVLKLHQESQGPLLLGGGFPYHILSLTCLISNSIGGPEGPLHQSVAFSTTSLSNFSDPQLTDFLSSPSYIIVQSPTQSLEWHVWSSSSGNNCHAVHRSLSSGASVYECIMGFYLVPFRQPNPPTWFLSITGHWNVSLPSGASFWNGVLGRVEGQYTTALLHCHHSLVHSGLKW